MTSVKIRPVSGGDNDLHRSGAPLPPDVPVDSFARMDDGAARTADEQLKRWHQQGLASAHSQESVETGRTLAPTTLDPYDLHSLYLILVLVTSLLCLCGVLAKIRTHFRKQRALKRHKQKKDE